MTKFKVGDRVQRIYDRYSPTSLLFGTIKEASKNVYLVAFDKEFKDFYGTLYKKGDLREVSASYLILADNQLELDF